MLNAISVSDGYVREIALAIPSQCQWSNPDWYGKYSYDLLRADAITITNKAKQNRMNDLWGIPYVGVYQMPAMQARFTPCLLMRMRYLSRRNIPLSSSALCCIAMLTKWIPATTAASNGNVLNASSYIYIIYSNAYSVLFCSFRGGQWPVIGINMMRTFLLYRSWLHQRQLIVRILVCRWWGKLLAYFIHLGTSFSEIIIKFQSSTFKKMPLKMASVKWQPFGIHLNVLKRQWSHFSF